MINQSTCEHLILKPDLEIVLILEFRIQLLEALVKCRQCGAHYRIQAIDLYDNVALYQLTRLPSKHVEQTVRSVSRGSCSIDRAKDEIAYLKSQSSPCEHLLLSTSGEFTKTVDRSLLGSMSKPLDRNEGDFNGERLALVSSSE